LSIAIEAVTRRKSVTVKASLMKNKTIALTIISCILIRNIRQNAFATKVLILQAVDLILSRLTGISYFIITEKQSWTLILSTYSIWSDDIQPESNLFHMPRTAVHAPSNTCARCLRAYRQHYVSQVAQYPQPRIFSSTSPSRTSDASASAEKLESTNRAQNGSSKSVSSEASQQESGAMSRRLAEATEDAVLEGGRAGRKAIEEAGFSEELKQKLLERVQAQKFQSDNAAAFAEAGLSSRAGRGTRDIAASPAWTGTESTEDAVLRMLSDAHKPLKPGLRGKANAPAVVDLRVQREPKQSSGQRLANARDKSSIYSIAKDTQMSEKEQEAMRKELKERFMPGARAMPSTFQGLAALANERIEDAIARGQFKNIPRGKAIERDARADNPFIDTTEYIMNKMIQRQDIVPPWIEKQQELVRAANVFRGRLRNDWKRHAARTISSRGGSLQEQVKRAEQNAESERFYNPKKRAVEQISVPTNVTSDPVMVKITQEAPSPMSRDNPVPVVQVAVETKDAEIPITEPVQVPVTTSATEALGGTSPSTPEPATPRPLPAPFRDSVWEKAELSYLTLAITNLNNLTRSYNLMAPELAKKPYFSLERELKSCYADVAPQLGQDIIERAARPAKDLVEKVGHRPGGLLEKFGGETANVYDSKKPLYGFREFWNDLWGERRV